MPTAGRGRAKYGMAGWRYALRNKLNSSHAVLRKSTRFIGSLPNQIDETWKDWFFDATTRRGQVSWAELETPDAPTRRAQLSWSELEIPDATARRSQLSWAEFEIPDVTVRRSQVSWAELETPDIAPRRGYLSWAEFEVPSFARGQISWAEFEVPGSAAGGGRMRRIGKWFRNQ